LKKTFKYISQTIDAIIDIIGRAVSWLTLVLMILICGDVIMRYLFNSTKTWIIELEWHIFSILFLIGASYTLLHDKHVRVDVFYENLSLRKKDIINAVGIILFLIPWCLMLLDTSWDYASNSFSFREKSSQPNGLPGRYVIKFFIWIGFFLLLLQGISQLIKATVATKSE
jgi:TRAP-type mannitol/chloroaromatic compound transport system permease small subunit